MSEELAQGPYVMTRVGFEPAGLNAPNLPLSHHTPLVNIFIRHLFKISTYFKKAGMLRRALVK